MAGTPTEVPERFVCMNCYVVSSGLPAERSPEPKHYEPPSTCGACERDDFVTFTEFHRAYDRRTE